MACATIAATEDFVREQFNQAIEQCRPIGPVARAILNVLISETASHAQVDEVAPFGGADRYVIRQVLGVLTDKYSRPIVQLTLSLEG